MASRDTFLLGFIGCIAVIAMIAVISLGTSNISFSDDNLVGDASFSKFSIRGFIDVFTPDQIAGWAYDPRSPATSVNVLFYVDGVLKKSVVADLERSDVNAAFSIRGNHGFSTSIKEFLTPGKTHRIQIVAENAGRTRTLLVRTMRIDLPPKQTDAATIVSQQMPSSMVAGKEYPVIVVVKNTGERTWGAPSSEFASDVESYALGLRVSDDAGWDVSPIALEPGVLVRPGESYTFSFKVLAPQKEGPHSLQWQMMYKNSGWFGTPSSPHVVTVQITTNLLSAQPNPCSVFPPQTQCRTNVSWPSTAHLGYSHVQLWNQDNANVSCSPSAVAGSLLRFVTPGQPKTFRLYPASGCKKVEAHTADGDLGSVVVTAIPATGTLGMSFGNVNTPELFVVGTQYPVSVSVRNTGSVPWVGGDVELRAVNIDGAAWNPGVVSLPVGVTVLPGQSYTFSFSVTASPGKSVRLFAWKLYHVNAGQFFGPDMEHLWRITDAPYVGTPSMKTVNIWEYVVGDPTKKMCLDGDTICQTIYPLGTHSSLVVRDDTLIVKYIKNDALNTIGVLKDGVQDGVQNGNVQLRCLTTTPGSCQNGPLPSMPLTATLPVLPSSAVNRHLITEEGVDSQIKKTFWWNPVSYSTCQPTGTAGSITHSGKIFLLESYDFGGDVGVQYDVLVYEGVGGYPTDRPLSQLSPWGAMRLERYLFVKNKGYYQEDGIEDPDCRDSPSSTTCNGVYSRFFSFEPATWRWIKPTPVPLVDYCPSI